MREYKIDVLANYIEKSIGIIQGLDLDKLASFPIGQEIDRGSGFGMYTHSHISGLDIGLKVPRESMPVHSRVLGELATATFILEHIPELEPQLPAFMGMIVIRTGTGLIRAANVTEDASRGKSVDVWPKRLNQETIELLKERFAQFGPFGDIFDQEVLRNSIAFDVDGQERLLDFTPPPFSFKHYLKLPGYDSSFEQAVDLEKGWTVEVPDDSPLAQSLISR